MTGMPPFIVTLSLQGTIRGIAYVITDGRSVSCDLNEYAQYVEKVRTYTKEDNLDNAVERAVNECIHDGILADFLTQNKSEVIAMSIFEYDEKAVRQVYYEDGLQAGRKDGIKTGILNMLRAKKYSLEEISEVFQVPVEEIEQIKNQQM